MKYEFKGTKGQWKIVLSSGICIGVGVERSPGYHEMISNTILPDSDREYKKQKKQIIADARMQAAAPELFEIAKLIMESIEGGGRTVTFQDEHILQLSSALNKACGYNFYNPEPNP